jgi:hypothetical protein
MSFSEQADLWEANKTIAALRAANLRMREALESIVTHQEIVAGPESSLLSSTARIARSALTPAEGGGDA